MPAEKMPTEVKSGFENDIANGGTKVEIDVCGGLWSKYSTTYPA